MVIQFAKILTDYPDEVTYGIPFDFEIGHLEADFYIGSERDSIEQDKIVAGTDFRSTEMYVSGNIGAEYQAFENGKPLGFRVSCIAKHNGEDAWILYREENDLIMSCTKTNVSSPLYLCVPSNWKNYNVSVNRLVQAMEVANKVFSGFENVKYGLCNSNYGGLTFVGEYYLAGYGWTSGYGLSDRSSMHERSLGLQNFYGWYTLLTGKYFKTPLTVRTKDGYEIALGRAEDYKTRDVLVSGNKQAYWKQYMPGTSIGWLQKRYGNIILLESGGTIALSTDNNNSFITVSRTGTYNEELVNYELKNRVSSISYNGERYFGYVQYLIDATKNGDYIDTYNLVNYQFIIGPTYWKVNANDFEEFINTHESEDWKHIPDAVIALTALYAPKSIDDYMYEAYEEFFESESTEEAEQRMVSYWTELPYSKDTNGSFVTSDVLYGGFNNLDEGFKWVFLLNIGPTPISPVDPDYGSGSIGGGGRIGGGNGAFDDSSDSITDIDGIAGYSTSGGQMCYITLPEPIRGEATTNEILGAIGSLLTDNNIWVDYSKYVDAITSGKIVYFPNGEMPSVSDGTYKFSILTRALKHPGSVADYYQTLKCNNRYKTILLGGFKIDEYFGNFLDYENTFIKMYLPFVGFVDLKPSEVMNNHCILKVVIDAFSGLLTYSLLVMDGEGHENVLYNYSGSCAVDIPFSAIDYSNRTTAGVNLVISAAVAVASASATGGTSLGAIPAIAATGGIFKSANDLAKNMTGDAKRSGSNAGLSGVMSPKVPYLVITRPKMVISDNYAHTYGLPCNLSARLDTLPAGFCKIKEIHMEGIPAPVDELEELEGILKEGFIL